MGGFFCYNLNEKFRGVSPTQKRENVMDQKLIERINELAQKAKTQGLTAEEAQEREALRKQYLAEFRKGFQQILDNTYVETPDGEKTKLQRKTEVEEKPLS